MSIPEPKFAVGECVMVRSFEDPSVNSDCSFVTHKIYQSWETKYSGVVGEMWGYLVDTDSETDCFGAPVYLSEFILKKRPEPGQDWESLRDGLKLTRVETA